MRWPVVHVHAHVGEEPEIPTARQFLFIAHTLFVVNLRQQGHAFRRALNRLPFHVLLLSLLTGCATQLPHEVRIPVPVPCIAEPVKPPVWLTDEQIKALPDYSLVLHLWLERRERQVYEGELEAMLAGCS